MRYSLFGMVICLFISSTAAADIINDHLMELAQNGVSSNTASGEAQTTIIDSGGSLKMVPRGTPSPPNPTAGPNERNPEQQPNANDAIAEPSQMPPETGLLAPLPKEPSQNSLSPQSGAPEPAKQLPNGVPSSGTGPSNTPGRGSY